MNRTANPTSSTRRSKEQQSYRSMDSDDLRAYIGDDNRASTTRGSFASDERRVGDF